MEESVIYQDILQKGERNKAFRIVSRKLNKRFGDINSTIIERIRVLSTAQLEVLALESLDFSGTSDLETCLNQHSQRLI